MQIYETMSSIKSKCKLGYVLVLPRTHMDISALISRHRIPSTISSSFPLFSAKQMRRYQNSVGRRKKTNFQWRQR